MNVVKKFFAVLTLGYISVLVMLFGLIATSNILLATMK